jgi:transposase-like protein
MGQRGPKSRFSDVVCPNEACPHHNKRNAGNIKANGRYTTLSGLVRKFVCHSCGGVFCEREGTAFYDLRSPEDKVLLALELVLRGMALRAVAGALKVKLDTVRFWLSQAAAHADLVNDALVKRVRVERVELDELWTFVRKKNFRGWQAMRRERMKAQTTGRPGSGWRSPQSRA